MDNFSISKLDKNIFLNIKKIIGEKNKDFQALLTAKKLLTEQYTSQKLGLQTNQEEQKRNTLLLEDLKNKIKEFDEHKIEKAKQERDQIFSSFSQIDKTVNYALFNKATQNNTFKREENEAPQQIQNFEEARLFLEKCAEKGKHTKQEITHLQDLQKQNQEKQQFWNEKQKGELENLKEKQKLLQQAVDEARQNYKNCSTNIDNEKLFSCDKIQGNCPYITLINKKHFEEREKEQQKFLEILEQKEKELKEFNFTEKFQKKEEEKSDYDFEKKHQELSEKIKNSEKLCEDLRDFLLQAQYSEMKQKNEERSNMFKEFQIKDKIFNQLFEEKEKIQKYQQEIIAGETKLENLKKQEEELQQQFQKTQEQLQKQEEELQKISSQSLEKNNLEIENFLKSYENIE
ncbi:hypothetical protein IJM86_06365 [bacterium]|nr:hypothetical protein [bacterium]